MSKARPSRTLFFFTLIFVFAFHARAQQQTTDPWDVLGDYTCSVPGSEASSVKLFLLPDMSWDRVAPFTLLPRRMGWIGVQTRGWRGWLHYAFKPRGVFKVNADVVELYNAELVDDGYAVRVGLLDSGLFRGLIKIERPTALPVPFQTKAWATLLVQSFRFDRNSAQLTEVLPLDSARLPTRCDQHPLFTGDPSL